MQSEIVQFQAGLNKVGRFLDIVRLAPNELKPLFVTGERKLTFTVLRRLYDVQFSPEGSNLRTLEEKALYCLEAYLADCSGEFYTAVKDCLFRSHR